MNAHLERTAEVIKDLLYLMQVETEGPQPDDEDGSDAWLARLELDARYWTKQFCRHYEASIRSKEHSNAIGALKLQAQLTRLLEGS